MLDENESALMLDDIVHDALTTVEAPLSKLFAHYDSFRINQALRQLNLVNAEYAPVPDDPKALFQQWEREWTDAVFEARDRLLNCAAFADVTSLADRIPINDKLGAFNRTV